MDAGRELDALVAEKVMGRWWTPLEVQSEYVNPATPFSTDIAAAWQVVERLRQQGRQWFGINIDDEKLGGKWRAGFSVVDNRWLGDYTTAETAPLAICLAALKAVGCPVEASQADGRLPDGVAPTTERS